MAGEFIANYHAKKAANITLSCDTGHAQTPQKTTIFSSSFA
ncbi:hypothetical protein [Vibrio pectenicida]|nr:hypothetical protein [Vibrio pectenicida]